MLPFRVIGTAGHIDHGKTSLVRALTGVDTDRLKEEKARGITIELGFAPLSLPCGQVVSVVDVPGHERFLRTMVCGAVGIDAVVLVISADEGVRPQTQEHLDVCELLGVKAGLVALTKCDLVSPDWLALVEQDVQKLLAGTFLQNVPIVPCSTVSRRGLAEMLHAIEQVLSPLPTRDAESPVRLPIDRLFCRKGFGTVVAGTLWSGSLRVGDELVALPHGDKTAKVRGLEAHGQKTETARAGQRVAVNLSLAHTELHRGDTLVCPGQLCTSSSLLVKLRLLPSVAAPLARRSRWMIHLGCAQRLCNVLLLSKDALEAGQTAFARVTLAEPLCVLPGDRFVLRGFRKLKNYATTAGGGLVLQNDRWPRGRKWQRDLAGLERLSALLPRTEPKGDPLLVEFFAKQANVCGVGLRSLQHGLPLSGRACLSALSHLVADAKLVRLPTIDEQQDGAWLSQEAFRAARDNILATVTALAKQSQAGPGVLKELVRQKRPELSDLVFAAVCEGLIAEGLLGQRLERLVLTALVQDTALPHPAAQAILSAVAAAGLTGPRFLELLPDLERAQPSVTRAAFVETLSALLFEKRVFRIQELLFGHAALDALRERLVLFLQKHREITPAEWKELVGQSRKVCIPLAEHFDAERLTLRIGNVRRLRFPQ